MVISFGDNLDKSFAYANSVFKKFSSWFILIVLYSLVIGCATAVAFGVCFVLLGYLSIAGVMTPDSAGSAGLAMAMLGVSLALIIVGTIISIILGFFVNGINVRVYRGGELSLSSPGKMFAEGFFATLIMLIYMIPYIIVSILVSLGPMGNPVYLIVVGLIIPVLLYIVTVLIAMFGVIRYAKTGKLGSAFEIKDICSVISYIGWLRYLGYMILVGLIVGIVVCIIYMIPIVGIILGVVVSPFAAIMTARFFGNLYESATE
ncbi:MAG: DUF4013 domain-containing protein [Methanocorpusculum sp.]|nr:DUF4013 domain-containing protein [Methanocorpusculum sp.]